MTTTRKVNKAFNNIMHAPTPKPADGCVHAYDVGPPPRQHHTCRYCNKQFEVPMTYGLELAKVGLGKVRPSVRYGAKLMEVGVEAGGKAVDVEERDE